MNAHCVNEHFIEKSIIMFLFGIPLTRFEISISFVKELANFLVMAGNYPNVVEIKIL